ncbi:cytochrome c [Urbifossiella limnaea]|uniref:Cytochrome C n=1 Tax=Urbifossiella limnaea TaxID=2528023 RepID=A0A517XSA6_9BACT|nr:cytochrome c [Urbifossiella limnaea]QDU20396.1 Cytochrome C' [Urbifossiella limnaea]
MTPRSRLFACSTLAVAFGFVVAPRAVSADLSKDAAKAAVAADVATLEKQLAELSSTQKKNLAVGARGIALLLMNYGDEPTKAQAAKVYAGLKLKEKDYKGGVEAVKALASPPAGGKFDSKAIDGTFELHDVMHPFSMSKSGGLNIEKDIRDLSKAGAKVDAKDALVLGARVAAIADYTLKLPNEKALTNASMKTKWERWSKDMGTAGVGLTEAAAKNDAKAMTTALKKMGDSCSNCHNDFRD